MFLQNEIFYTNIGDEIMCLKQILRKNIRYYRFKNNYTQEHLAELLDISTTYMSDIECGKRNVSLDIIEQIIQLFEIPCDALFKSNEEELPNKITHYDKEKITN